MLTKKQILEITEKGEFEVEFIKKNGEKRIMKATREFDYEKTTNRVAAPTQCVCYDLEKKGIRSFRYDSVISIRRLSEIKKNPMLFSADYSKSERAFVVAILKKSTQRVDNI